MWNPRVIDVVGRDAQERLGVGRGPAVEREGDLAAHLAQSVADANDLRFIRLLYRAPDGACRKSGGLGLEQAQHLSKLFLFDDCERLVAAHYPLDEEPGEFFQRIRGRDGPKIGLVGCQSSIQSLGSGVEKTQRGG